jgi:hypothetical protein
MCWCGAIRRYLSVVEENEVEFGYRSSGKSVLSACCFVYNRKELLPTQEERDLPKRVTDLTMRSIVRQGRVLD